MLPEHFFEISSILPLFNSPKGHFNGLRNILSLFSSFLKRNNDTNKGKLKSLFWYRKYFQRGLNVFRKGGFQALWLSFPMVYHDKILISVQLISQQKAKKMRKCFGFGKELFWFQYRNWTLVPVPNTKTWFRLHNSNSSFGKLKTLFFYLTSVSWILF